MAVIIVGPIVPSGARSKASGIVIGTGKDPARAGTCNRRPLDHPRRRRSASAKSPLKSETTPPRVVDADTLEMAGQRGSASRALMPPNPRKPAARPPANATGAESAPRRALRARIGAGASHVYD